MALNKLFYMRQLLPNVRKVHTTLSKAKYEGSGKTTVHLLNQEKDNTNIFITRALTIGFELNDGGLLIGPLVIFPKTILCWNVGSAEGINEASLSLFTALDPKLDILVLGLEKPYGLKRINEIKRVLVEKNINVEILPVHKACGIYNFLSKEGRYVAAGLIPPIKEESYKYKQIQSVKQKIENQKALTSD